MNGVICKYCQSESVIKYGHVSNEGKMSQEQLRFSRTVFLHRNPTLILFSQWYLHS
jgi:hypothetical protein